MNQVYLEQREQEILDSKVWMALFAAILISLALALSAEINRPFINGVDFNGAVWSQSAHNILRAGLIETSGASSGFYFGPLPIPAWLLSASPAGAPSGDRPSFRGPRRT